MVTQERLCSISMPPSFCIVFPLSFLYWQECSRGNELAGEQTNLLDDSLSYIIAPSLSLISAGVAVALMAAFVWHCELCYSRYDSNIPDQTYTHACTDPLYKCPLRFIIKAACGRRFEEQNMKWIKQIVWSWRDSHAVRRYLSFSSQ